MTLTLPAPAKLNLFLHITGRRADGYHDLQTVFQLLEHGDVLHFTPTADGKLQFSCSDPTLAGNDNLVVRAARLLQEHAAPGAGCRIQLDKRLPCGGGLGGGSSDAATTLLALNRLWRCGLTLTELARLGLSLGADVPVFVGGHTAWAEGLGERLVPLHSPEDWFVVLTPRCHVATGLIFSHPELTRDSVPIRMPPFPFSGCQNDCESVTCQLYPQVRQTLSWLRGKGPAGMSGTGASVFARCTSRAAAEAILALATKELDGAGGRDGGDAGDIAVSGFVARGCNRSPVHALLDQPER